MNKEEILKELFKLSQREIIDIYETLNGYKNAISRSGKDNLLLRCVFINGYRSTKEFYNEYNLTKDSAIATALFDGCNSLKVYLELKEKLNIDDDTFLKILVDKVGDK